MSFGSFLTQCIRQLLAEAAKLDVAIAAQPEEFRHGE